MFCCCNLGYDDTALQLLLRSHNWLMMTHLPRPRKKQWILMFTKTVTTAYQAIGQHELLLYPNASKERSIASLLKFYDIYNPVYIIYIHISYIIYIHIYYIYNIGYIYNIWYIYIYIYISYIKSYLSTIWWEEKRKWARRRPVSGSWPVTL